MPADSSDREHWALVDAHVHFHPCFDEDLFFRSAMANFSEAARVLGIRGGWTGILVLTEESKKDDFRRFLDRTSKSQPGEMIFEPTSEGTSFLVRNRAEDGFGGVRLVMVAGRQIGTAEGLEALAFPALESPPSGLSLDDTIARIQGVGAIPVLPWGLGKWWGGRGKLIESTLRKGRRGGVMLADTGHRPGMAPFPRMLRLGEALSVPVLAGSDPLPFRGEDRRPGSCLFVLSTDELQGRPGLSVKRALGKLSGSPPRYGKKPSLPRFLYAQTAMQVRRRFVGERR